MQQKEEVPERFVNSAIIGFFRSGATMEEMCAATGLYWETIKDIIDGYKKEIGHPGTHSTTRGNSFTCTST